LLFVPVMRWSKFIFGSSNWHRFTMILLQVRDGLSTKYKCYPLPLLLIQDMFVLAIIWLPSQPPQSESHLFFSWTWPSMLPFCHTAHQNIQNSSSRAQSVFKVVHPKGGAKLNYCNLGTVQLCSKGQGEKYIAIESCWNAMYRTMPPEWTSTHQLTIHCMPVMTQLWMNLNRVNIWFIGWFIVYGLSLLPTYCQPAWNLLVGRY
jgi:hypothetical protein